MVSNIGNFNFYDVNEGNPLFNAELVSDVDFANLLTAHLRRLGLPDSVELRYVLKFNNDDVRQYPVFEIFDGSTSVFHSFRRVMLNSFYQGLAARRDRLLNEYLVDDLDFSDNDVIIDCGANVGEFGVFLSSRKSNLKYIAFEPGPIEHHLLKLNQPSAYQLFNVALSNRSEESYLFYKPGFADSSIIPIGHYDSVLSTRTFRLEDLLTDYSMKVKLLKLEAEGTEPEVLQGCDKILSRIDYIAADLGFERGERQESSAPFVVNFLLERDFSLEKIHPIRKTFLFRNKILGYPT